MQDTPRKNMWRIVLKVILSVLFLGLIGTLGYLSYPLSRLGSKLRKAPLTRFNKTCGTPLLQMPLLAASCRMNEIVTMSFQNEFAQISSTVGTLTKLAQTDPQLLQKYSKVYFLNENYVPARLTPIAPEYVLCTK